MDMRSEKILFNTYVAHGRNSGNRMVSSHFSNAPNSHQSNIGVLLTGGAYFGHDGYSLHLKGLEKGYNDHAFSRGIVIHGAKYVNPHLAKKHLLGRSWGCPAVSLHMVKPIIDTLSEGSVVLLYYPDPHWLSSSAYLRGFEKTGKK